MRRIQATFGKNIVGLPPTMTMQLIAIFVTRRQNFF
jgi:hypothetical protein